VEREQLRPYDARIVWAEIEQLGGIPMVVEGAIEVEVIFPVVNLPEVVPR
jgi:hypothetical protein